MKLTNTLRDAFVRSAMNDLPYVDYKQQIRDLALKTAVEAMPAKLRAVWDDKELHGCLSTSWFRITDCVSSDLPSFSGRTEAIEAQRSALEALHAQHHAQEATRDDLRRKIHAVAYSVTTRKALAQALPEFEKYLPPDEAAANRSLPVVANVVAEFVKAGWPKEKVA